METINDLKDKLTDAAASLGDSATDVARNLQSQAKDAWDTVQDQTQHALRESAAFATRHAVPTALVACGIGLVAGLALNRRAPASLTDSHIVKPLYQSRGLLLGVLIACGTLFKRTFSGAAAELADLARDNGKAAVKTTKRAVRKAARKLDQ